jgi:XcyI restriction endonuclease
VTFTPPPSSRQLAFHERLVAARKRWLAPALQAALKQADPTLVAEEIGSLVSASSRRALAAAKIRDEYVFPTPVVLRTSPMLLGYYRLLLGRPQKSFYSRALDGFGMFKSMEERGVITNKQERLLNDLCQALCDAISSLIEEIAPDISAEDVYELPLLTLGSQLQGANNNVIGQEATRDVFNSIKSLVPSASILSQTAAEIILRNPAGRRVWVTMAGDPDVRVQEENNSPPPSFHYKLAIEIKGGSDASNAHNRAGEAEKSHRKAREQGCPEFWTIIATKSVDMKRLTTESPTTNHFFNTSEILAMAGSDWNNFAARLKSVIGI